MLVTPYSGIAKITLPRELAAINEENLSYETYNLYSRDEKKPFTRGYLPGPRDGNGSFYVEDFCHGFHEFALILIRGNSGQLSLPQNI
jgi:hypothetical protein